MCCTSYSYTYSILVIRVNSIILDFPNTTSRDLHIQSSNSQNKVAFAYFAKFEL